MNSKLSIMKNLLAALIPLALMAESGFVDSSFSDNRRTKESEIDFAPKIPPIPKGCQRVYYNENGICCMSESKIYFDARTPSNANKKYKRWCEINLAK